ncbi:MAG: DUF4149 domain-containing protein [Planctomycetota bacterium]
MNGRFANSDGFDVTVRATSRFVIQLPRTVISTRPTTVIQSLRDAAITAEFVLIAGGGTAFFVFARVLFNRVPGFSDHPRFDAGEIVGPLIYISNFVNLIFGVTILFATLARQTELNISQKVNRAVGAVSLLILLIALIERFYLIPEITNLRTAVGRSGFDDGVTSPERSRFGMLHGINNLTQMATVILAWAGIFLERAVRKTRP